jgi:adenine phosphoribosyltransferase
VAGDLAERLRRAIVEVPDYPKPGILFRDLTPVYQDPSLLRAVARFGAARARRWGAEAVAGIESRGFVAGAPMAAAANLPFVMVRKAGKLPRPSVAERYALEYDEATLEAHADALAPGSRVAIVDDLLATGGTAAAAARIVGRLGARVAGFVFVVELAALGGRAKLGDAPVASMVTY